MNWTREGVINVTGLGGLALLGVGVAGAVDVWHAMIVIGAVAAAASISAAIISRVDRMR